MSESPRSAALFYFGCVCRGGSKHNCGALSTENALYLPRN
jgi:hypothetical protein